MPLLDLLPSHLTLDENGFELRWLGKTRRVAWDEIECARVGPRLLVRTRAGVVLVPRNARGYLDLFSTLRRRSLLELPQQLGWTTSKAALAVFAVGFGLIGIGAACEGLLAFVFLGICVAALAPFCWERYRVDEHGADVRSIFGFKRYERDHLQGVWLAGGRQEVVAALLSGSHLRPIDRRLGVRCARPRLGSLHVLTWLLCGSQIILCLAVGLHGFGTVYALVLAAITRGRFCVRIEARGLWRVSLLGRRWDEGTAFVRVRQTSWATTLVRRDGSQVVLPRVPVDWILRHWMPNPVSAERDSYRTVSRGSNRRHGELRVT